MDSGLKYLKELSILEDKKASMVWNLVIIEQYLEDSQHDNACKTLLQIADDLETVVDLIKSNSEMTSVPDIASEIKNINEFADEFSELVRGRSWASICRAFDPKESLDKIKTLKSIMKRSKKKPTRRRVPGGMVQSRVVPDETVPDKSIEIKNSINNDLIRLREIKKRAEGRKLENRILNRDTDEALRDDKPLNLKTFFFK